MKYLTTCGNKYPNLIEQSKCDNIDIGHEYEFVIEITLLEYPTNDKEYVSE